MDRSGTVPLGDLVSALYESSREIYGNREIAARVTQLVICKLMRARELRRPALAAST